MRGLTRVTIVGTTLDKLKLVDNPTGILIILWHFRFMLNIDVKLT